MESRRESQYKRNGNLIDSILLQKSYLFQSNFSTSFFLNGEGGIRTLEGVTPTRFRVVRDQPGSATSPKRQKDAFRF